MARKTWVGTSSSYTTAGNWLPAGVPVAADDVVFDDLSVHDVAGADQIAVSLKSFTITDRYTGNIGSSGSPLYLSGSQAIIRSSGDELWIDARFSHAILAPTQMAENACRWGGEMGELGTICVAGGYVTIVAGSTWPGGIGITVSPEQRGRSYTTMLVIEAGQTTSATEYLCIAGGVVIMEDTLDGETSAILMSGGRLVLTEEAGTTARIVASGGVIQHDAGIVAHAWIGGNAVWDGAREVTTGRAVTVMQIHGPSAQADFRNGTETSFPGTMRPYGNPRILTDPTYDAQYSFS